MRQEGGEQTTDKTKDIPSKKRQIPSKSGSYQCEIELERTQATQIIVQGLNTNSK